MQASRVADTITIDLDQILVEYYLVLIPPLSTLSHSKIKIWTRVVCKYA